MANTRQYFAAYVQAVDTRNGARTQFIVLPPVVMSPTTNGVVLAWSNQMCWFERQQTVSQQKTRWSFQYESNDGVVSIENRLVFYTSRPEFLVPPPVVIEVNPIDIEEICRLRKTPYNLIMRLERQTLCQGIIIQGPTSVPQVVTAPVSS